MQRLFVDTSAWFAYANRKDHGHTAVRTAIAGFDGRLVTSNFALMRRLGIDTALALDEDFRAEGFRVIP